MTPAELAEIRARAADGRQHQACSTAPCGSRYCRTARDRDALLAEVERLRGINAELVETHNDYLLYVQKGEAGRGRLRAEGADAERLAYERGKEVERLTAENARLHDEVDEERAEHLLAASQRDGWARDYVQIEAERDRLRSFRDAVLAEIDGEPIGWDNRKTLAHLWQQHAPLPAEGLSENVYSALIAVANYDDLAKRLHALATEHGLSERQNAPEPPADAGTGAGSREGVNGAQEGAGEFGLRHIDVALSLEAFERAMGSLADGTACGDVLRDHGDVGPCVLSGRHEVHDDGRGITWVRSRVEP
jgi:hypothetical protein